MAQCAYCSATILFGGQRAGDYVFCNARCLLHGRPLLLANDRVDVADLDQTVRDLREDLLIVVDELQQLRASLNEANERIDFTERALVQLRGAMKVPPASA